MGRRHHLFGEWTDGESWCCRGILKAIACAQYRQFFPIQAEYFHSATQRDDRSRGHSEARAKDLDHKAIGADAEPRSGGFLGMCHIYVHFPLFEHNFPSFIVNS